MLEKIKINSSLYCDRQKLKTRKEQINLLAKKAEQYCIEM